MFNKYAEQIVLAGDDTRRRLYPRLGTGHMRRAIDDAHKRGLTVMAVVLYNCQTEYLYDWRGTLQNKKWLGRTMTMTRQRGEYVGTQDAILVPAHVRDYSVGELKQLFLEGGR